MHITGIAVEDIDDLFNVNWISLDKRVNLFIGPNASGKTSLLRIINKACSMGTEQRRAGDGDTDLTFLGDKLIDDEGVDSGEGYIFVDLSDDWPRDSDGKIADTMQAIKDTVPLQYIPATRINPLGTDILRPTIGKEDTVEIDDHLLERTFNTDSGIFDVRSVQRFIQSGRASGGYFREAVQIGYSCAKSICSEIIHGNEPLHYIEEPSHTLETPDMKRIVRYNMGIRTSDDVSEEPLYAGNLSSGTQGTLLWVWALALKILWDTLRRRRSTRPPKGWENKPAILLIDEIENHLHPTWQRRVIPALLEHFPGLQIFATTHSPFVVAGLKAGQVHLLNRDENGVVTAKTNTENVIGWTADEILRTMMGVDEPTDQLTVNRANRLRQLREKETLTPEEESELNELRRQVNKDLLSKGGPLEAQRERYADLMREFLTSRQSELTQDGG